MFETACHCGNLKLKAKSAPKSLTDCNCSICRRYAALWAYYLDHQVEIETGPATSVSYAWDKKTIDFIHCPVCGCCTHYLSRLDDGRLRVAINARMAETGAIDGIRLRKFDGADSWAYLDE